MPMICDLREDGSRERLGQFIEWLQSETISSLTRPAGDADAIRAALLLFVNRALEAHLPEESIGEVLGVSVVRGGLREERQKLAFDEAEALADLLKRTHDLT